MAATFDRFIESHMDKEGTKRPSKSLYRYHSATLTAPRSPSPPSFSPSPYVINFKGRRASSTIELPMENGSTSKFRDPGPSEQPYAERLDVKAGGAEAQEGKKQWNGYVQDDMVGKSLNDKQVVEARGFEETKPPPTPQASRRLSFASSSGYGDEFFDAADSPLDETSSQSEFSFNVSAEHIEAESAEHLQELERCRKAEEALEIVLQKLADGGLALPANLLDKDRRPVELREQVEDLDIAGQLLIKRMVEAAVARGAAKAEVELNLEGELESKSREVTRLRDKVRYNELVNREMSQRNQEAIEMARNKRRARQRKIRWAVASVSVAAVLGVSAAVVYKCAPWQDIKLWKPKTEGSRADARKN